MTGREGGLDEVDIRVLSSVSADPSGTLDSLARASGMTPRTLGARLRSLGERGILYPGFARADVSYAAVGLELVVVFAGTARSHRQAFESACDSHPYTQYRIRCLGKLDGKDSVSMFSVPLGSRASLNAFLEGLVDVGVLDSFSTSIPVGRAVRTEFDLALYDAGLRSWRFDWSRWDSSIDSGVPLVERLQKSALHLLDLTDVKILRLLSMDARAEKRTIAEKVGVRDYELSRRLSRLRENHVIDGYRVIHDRNIAGHAQTVALRAKASVKTTGALASAFRALPFPGWFYPVDGGFVYFGNVPPVELASLTKSVESRCDSFELALCDYASSMRYLFDNDPSNFKDGYGWADDFAYIVDAPIASIVAAKGGTADRRPPR